MKPTSLQGMRLENGKYIAIASSILPEGTLSLHSEVLGLDLHLYPDLGFRFFDPISNQILWSYDEAELARSQAELERSFEHQARLEAEVIVERANLEKQLAEQAQQKAEQKAERLVELLKAMGINTDTI